MLNDIEGCHIDAHNNIQSIRQDSIWKTTPQDEGASLSGSAVRKYHKLAVLQTLKKLVAFIHSFSEGKHADKQVADIRGFQILALDPGKGGVPSIAAVDQQLGNRNSYCKPDLVENEARWDSQQLSQLPQLLIDCSDCWNPPPSSGPPCPGLESRLLTASRRGQEKQGRHRSAAVPHNQLSWEDVGQMWQSVATCAHLKQTMATCRGSVAPW